MFNAGNPVAVNKILAKPTILPILSADRNLRVVESAGAVMRAHQGESGASERIAHNLRREFGSGDFFYFFGCNPLKSPDSEKEVKIKKTK
jgi:hypothetical protein